MQTKHPSPFRYRDRLDTHPVVALTLQAPPVVLFTMEKSGPVALATHWPLVVEIRRAPQIKANVTRARRAIVNSLLDNVAGLTSLVG
eukprot:m.375607 g.375607  ORF g.375607 m.375607 type:complete len:87 (+) comp28185_c0_seq3:2300-2560(+)